MDKLIVIKNALVLTLDESGRTGYFNIVIKNDKIFDIDYDNELTNNSVIFSKYPGAYIIDAHDKLIIPSFLNLNINSTYYQCSSFLKGFKYSNLSENLSASLVEKYFLEPKNRDELKSLVTVNYYSTLQNGEAVLLESSRLMSKEFLSENRKFGFLSYQDIVFTAYENPFSSFLSEKGFLHCLGIKDEDEINTYSLNALVSSFAAGKKILFFEVLQKSNSVEILKKNFSKSLIRLLSEAELISDKVIFNNPIYLNKDEIEILGRKKSNIVLSPTDIIKLGEKSFDFYDYINRDLNISLGTGYSGRSIMGELKLLVSFLHKDYFSYDEILRTATVNPSHALKISDNYGSIEKNKFANLIFFNLNDLRNILNVPEINSEKVCEFLIENFDTKDISDVIIKGIPVKRNNQCKLYNPDSIKQIKTSLTKKIYEVGMYLELKEKYLMRKRVNELTGNEPEKSAIFDDNYSTEDYSSFDSKAITDSEFRIIGVDDANDKVIEEIAGGGAEINEVDSLSDGFFVFEEEAIQTQAELKSENLGQIAKQEIKLRFEDSSDSEVTTLREVKETKAEKEVKKEDPKKIPPQEDSKIQFKKEKLRFGFSQEEE
ncbi:MAG: amidohydrolase family protein [Ignavibacteriae bacterium]|nr:amidohydrolase family protein [Ignavibacteriota bacterium]